jgi:hypothetical protein
METSPGHSSDSWVQLSQEKDKTVVVTKFPHIDKDHFCLLFVTLPNSASDGDAQSDDLLGRGYSPASFSIKTLCAAIQDSCTVDAIKRCTQSYRGSPKTHEVISRDGWPALYYAAQHNSGELVTLFLQHDVNARMADTSFPIPLLAYAVIYGEKKALDTSEVVKLLLAAGYDPTVIPMDMWINFLETPQEVPNPAIKVPEGAKRSAAWCTTEFRPVPAASIHLTHRYLLRLAHSLSPLRPRMLQIAGANKMTKLSKLPYFLIGQRSACDLVMKHKYSYISLGSQTPLVMAFAGPSGHGKTELAQAMVPSICGDSGD